MEFEKLVLIFHKVVDESEANRDEAARWRREFEAVQAELVTVKEVPSVAGELVSARREIERLEAMVQESALEKETITLEMDTQRVAHTSILAAKNAESLKARKAAALAEKKAESLEARVLELEETIKTLAVQLDSHLHNKYVGSSDRAVDAYHQALTDFSGEVFTGLEDPFLGIVGDLVKRVEALSPQFPSKEVPLFAAYLRKVGEKSAPSASEQLAEEIKKTLTDQALAGPSGGVGRATAGDESGSEGADDEKETSGGES